MDHRRAYRVLGIPAGASADEVRAAYLDLAQVWHPDRFQHDERLRRRAEQTLQHINEANDFLMTQGPRALPPGLAERLSQSLVSIMGPAGQRNSIRVLGLQPARARPRWIPLAVAGAALVAGLVALLFLQ